MVVQTVQVQFSDEDADVPVCYARQVFVVLKTVEVPQLQFIDVEDRRDSQLQYIDKVRRPCCGGVADPHRVVQKTVEIHSFAVH